LLLILSGVALDYALRSSDEEASLDADGEIVGFVFGDGSTRQVRYIEAEASVLGAAAEVGAPWIGSSMLAGILALVVLMYRRRAAGIALPNSQPTPIYNLFPEQPVELGPSIRPSFDRGMGDEDVLDSLYGQIMDAQVACSEVAAMADVAVHEVETRDNAIAAFRDLAEYVAMNRVWLNQLDQDVSGLPTTLGQAARTLQVTPAAFEPGPVAEELRVAAERAERQLKVLLSTLDTAA